MSGKIHQPADVRTDYSSTIVTEESRRLQRPKLKRFLNHFQREQSLPTVAEDSATGAPAQSSGQSAAPTSDTPPRVAPEFLYSHKKAIPYLRRSNQPVYVFFDAVSQISDDHRDRFADLKDILQRNAEKCRELYDWLADISYELHVCGTNQSNASPAVLITCPKHKAKRLQTVIDQPHVQDQCKPSRDSPANLYPELQIVIWAEPMVRSAFLVQDSEYIEGGVEDLATGAPDQSSGQSAAATRQSIWQADLPIFPASAEEKEKEEEQQQEQGYTDEERRDEQEQEEDAKYNDDAHAASEQRLDLSPLVRMLNAGRRWFDSIFCLAAVPEPRPGYSRLQYSCRCGLQLCDDYTEYRPGALENFKLLLRQQGFKVTTPGDLESNKPRQAPSSSRETGHSSETQKRHGLRSAVHWQRQASPILGQCQRKSREVQNEGNHNFVLVCIPYGRSIHKLQQPEVCTVASNEDFFSLLQFTYRQYRTRSTLSFVRRIKFVHFAHLEVYRTDLADIRSHPSIPPSAMSHQYKYEPMPSDFMPPIGSNLLVHLLENPTHAAALPHLYKRVPQKLQDRLSPCPQKGTSVGWGLALVEGVDYFIFFLCGCAGFLVSLLAALAWTLGKDDIQGGFGIGGFLLSFMVFCGGLVHSYITTRTSNVA